MYLMFRIYEKDTFLGRLRQYINHLFIYVMFRKAVFVCEYTFFPHGYQSYITNACRCFGCYPSFSSLPSND